MPIEIPPRGAVFEYPYRWAREASEGASPDGRKDRTVCLVLTVAVSVDRHILYLLAISSNPAGRGCGLRTRSPQRPQQLSLFNVSHQWGAVLLRLGGGRIADQVPETPRQSHRITVEPISVKLRIRVS